MYFLFFLNLGNFWIVYKLGFLIYYIIIGKNISFLVRNFGCFIVLLLIKILGNWFNFLGILVFLYLKGENVYLMWGLSLMIKRKCFWSC